MGQYTASLLVDIHKLKLEIPRKSSKKWFDICPIRFTSRHNEVVSAFLLEGDASLLAGA
jgi:hypothetical protein